MSGKVEETGDLEIGKVSRQAGVATSAIRYYEEIGLLPPAMRQRGRRRYDLSTLQRLEVIRRAREAGFTLVEIQELFFGFAVGTHPEARWDVLASRKRAELEEQLARIRDMQGRLREGLGCRCAEIEECSVWRSGLDVDER